MSIDFKTPLGVTLKDCVKSTVSRVRYSFKEGLQWLTDKPPTETMHVVWPRAFRFVDQYQWTPSDVFCVSWSVGMCNDTLKIPLAVLDMVTTEPWIAIPTSRVFLHPDVMGLPLVATQYTCNVNNLVLAVLTNPKDRLCIQNAPTIEVELISYEFSREHVRQLMTSYIHLYVRQYQIFTQLETVDVECMLARGILVIGKLFASSASDVALALTVTKNTSELDYHYTTDELKREQHAYLSSNNAAFQRRILNGLRDMPLVHACKRQVVRHLHDPENNVGVWIPLSHDPSDPHQVKIHTKNVTHIIVVTANLLRCLHGMATLATDHPCGLRRQMAQLRPKDDFRFTAS